MIKDKKNRSENAHRYCVYLPAETFERFKRLYPVSLSKFFGMCLEKSVRSRDFFENVFFGVRDE